MVGSFVSRRDDPCATPTLIPLSVAFASKNSLFRSIIDALGMGLGFTIVLAIIGAVREILGDGRLLGHYIFGTNFEPVLLMILPPGAFIVIGFLLGMIRWF